MESIWTCSEIERSEDTARGTLSLRLDGTEGAGRCFYTDRISTGLGEGLFELRFIPVDRYGYENGMLTTQRLLFGDAGVFAQSPYIPGMPAFTLGAYADPADGSFVLGLKLSANSVCCRVDVLWQAVKLDAEKSSGRRAPGSFYITNAPKLMAPGESVELNCVTPENAPLVSWTVEGENAGSITPYGVYTAPDTPGLYQVKAYLPGTDSMAAIYISVR